MRVVREGLSNFVCPSFSFGIEGEMWGVIVSIPDHCLSIYFLYQFEGHKTCTADASMTKRNKYCRVMAINVM